MINILNNICIMINKKKILKNYQCYSMYRYLINDRSLKFNEGKNIFELKIEKDLKNYEYIEYNFTVTKSSFDMCINYCLLENMQKNYEFNYLLLKNWLQSKHKTSNVTIERFKEYLD